MKNKGKKYAFKDDIDYDGMGNQGRVPNVEVKSKLSLIQKIKNKLWEVKGY